MARSAGRRYRWLIAALLGPAFATATEEPPPPRPVARADQKEPARTGEPVAKAKSPAANAPAAELLDWLGRYEGAGDGLDPLGLADFDTAAPARAAKDRQQ